MLIAEMQDSYFEQRAPSATIHRGIRLQQMNFHMSERSSLCEPRTNVRAMDKALDSIRRVLSAEARTVRGGETRMISAEQLVPDDTITVESGDKLPADLRLVDAKNLRFTPP
jgi:high-affinity K+ transport system ATPase subunit B